MTIREFKVSVDESKIDDLYKRIDLTRWPDEVNDEIWTLGTKKSFLKMLSSIGEMTLIGRYMRNK